MSIYHLNDAMMDRDFHWLFDSVADMIDELVEPLGTGKISLPAIPKRVSSFIAPYAFAGRLRLMYEYACGRQMLSREYIRESARALEKLLTLNVASMVLAKRADEEDDDAVVTGGVCGDGESILTSFFDHPVVQIVYAAQGRLAVNEGRPLTEDELSALVGLDAERAAAVGIESSVDARGKRMFSPDKILLVLQKTDSGDVRE